MKNLMKGFVVVAATAALSLTGGTSLAPQHAYADDGGYCVWRVTTTNYYTSDGTLYRQVITRQLQYCVG